MTRFESLDWDDLKVFIQASRASNFSGAAKRLKIDHSTVSRRITQLESTLGLSLFERQPTGIRLSESGERLLRYAERVEGAIVALREELAGHTGAATGPVRLATMEGIASLYLACRFSSFCATHEITVELVTSAQTVYVNRREADLFLSFFRPPGRGLVSEMVGRFRLQLYASSKYLEKHGTPRGVADIGEHAFVSYIEDLIQVDTVRWLDDVIAAPRIVFHSSSMIAQLYAAVGGIGLVLLPEFAVEGRTDLVPVLAGEVQTTRELWINVHGDLQYSPRIKAVAGFLKRTFQGDPIMQVSASPVQHCSVQSSNHS